jgi:hypothetical protein
MDWLAGGRPPTMRRDGHEGCVWISRSKRFLEAFRRCDNNPRLLAELADYDPVLFWPFDLYHDETNRRSRFAVEARILARQTNREIAFHTGCAELFIEIYEKVFFHVRDRLKHRDYIINTVFRESESRGRQDRECDLLWKMVGYFHGPRVLDALISGFVSPTWVTRPEDVDACFQDMAIRTIKQKAAIAALSVPVDSTTYLNLIDSFVKLTDIERHSDSAGQASDQIKQNIDAMLKALPFGVGTRPEDHLQQNPAVAAFDNMAAELRSDELINVALGRANPQLDQLKDLNFPPAPGGGTL